MSRQLRPWPVGRPLAVALSVMYEQWAPGAAPGLGPMGNPLPGGLLDRQALSWAAYGPRTGIWLLLDELAARELCASVHVSGILSETAPASVAAVAAAGHELCAHAWSQDRLVTSPDAAAERAEIARCVEGLAAAAGRRPTGWISPRCTPSERTASLLADAGFRWFGDVFDTDLPYPLSTPAGTIVALPFGLDVNDLPLNVRHGQPARELSATFEHVVEALLHEGRSTHLDVTVHAHVSGGPPAWAHFARSSTSPRHVTCGSPPGAASSTRWTPDLTYSRWCRPGSPRRTYAGPGPA
ncbi:MAG: polysaccharide deacetylase family protein [Actinomycetota bacterium]|nr:polysaccharide deacetylase family protein [Actinomycetota bacterium]